MFVIEVDNFMAEVQDLVEDYCDIDTRNKYPKIYGVTNHSDRRLLHMMKYIRDNGLMIVK